MINVVDGDCKFAFRYCCHVEALWQVLSNQAVGILVRAALPGGIWIGGVDLGAGGFFEDLGVFKCMHQIVDDSNSLCDLSYWLMEVDGQFPLS